MKDQLASARLVDAPIGVAVPPMCVSRNQARTKAGRYRPRYMLRLADDGVYGNTNVNQQEIELISKQPQLPLGERVVYDF